MVGDKSKRSDSAEFQVDVMKDVINSIQPPAHLKLREKDRPFWDAIVNARAQWTDVDLAHAANLARCQADIEENQQLLDMEGNVIENARGTPVMNPRFTILEQLSRRAVTISTRIQVHAAATVGEARAANPKNQRKMKMVDAMESFEDDDDLIAKPN